MQAENCKALHSLPSFKNETAFLWTRFMGLDYAYDDAQVIV